VERLAAESMPLAGLVLNRTHPVLAKLPVGRALAAADELERAGDAPLAAAVLRVHADRVAVATREQRLLARFTKAHPSVAVTGVPALAEDVHDLAGLREIGRRLAGE
jgi:anion-transporting  ArsA/GET3 family ATPase